MGVAAFYRLQGKADAARTGRCRLMTEADIICSNRKIHTDGKLCNAFGNRCVRGDVRSSSEKPQNEPDGRVAAQARHDIARKRR